MVEIKPDSGDKEEVEEGRRKEMIRWGGEKTKTPNGKPKYRIIGDAHNIEYYQVDQSESLGDRRCIGMRVRGWPRTAFHDGMVAGKMGERVPEEAVEVVAQLFIVDPKVKRFSRGYSPMLHCGTSNSACKVESVREYMLRC